MSEINTTLGTLGGLSNADAPDISTCKQLDDKNKEVRDKLDDSNTPEFNRAKDKNGNVKNTIQNKKKTISSVAINSKKCKYNGQILSGTSCSRTLRDEITNIHDFNNIVLAPLQEDFSNGINLCKNNDKPEETDKTDMSKYYPFPGNKKSMEAQSQCCGGHAEAGLLAKLGSSGCLTIGAQLTFKINWSNPALQEAPCPYCLRMLCKVAHNCGVDIQICNVNDEPLSLKTELDDENASNCKNNSEKTDKKGRKPTKGDGYEKITNKIMNKVTEATEYADIC